MIQFKRVLHSHQSKCSAPKILGLKHSSKKIKKVLWHVCLFVRTPHALVSTTLLDARLYDKSNILFLEIDLALIPDGEKKTQFLFQEHPFVLFLFPLYHTDRHQMGASSVLSSTWVMGLFWLVHSFMPLSEWQIALSQAVHPAILKLYLTKG